MNRNGGNISSASIFVIKQDILDKIASEDGKKQIEEGKKNMIADEVNLVKKKLSLLSGETKNNPSSDKETNNFFIEGSVDMLVIGDEISNSHYNSQYNDFLQKISNYVFISADNSGIFSTNRKLKNWLQGSKLEKIIGNEEGKYEGTMKKETDKYPFYLIFSKEPKDNEKLLHDYFISSFCLNNLRRKGNLCFPYTYGLFSCSPPLINENTKEVITWCRGSSDTSSLYLVKENISSFPSLEDEISRLTGSQFLNIYLQIAYSLSYAYELYRFTHYNLKASNVTLRQLDAKYQLRYNTESRDTYMTVEHIPLLTHFYSSYVVYEGKGYGIFTQLQNGVRPESGFPIHDCYKLLMTSAFKAKEVDNQDIFEVCSVIFKFFNKDESLQDALSRQLVNEYNLPFIEPFKNIPIYVLTAYIRENLEIKFMSDVITPSSLVEKPLLECSRVNSWLCKSLDEIERETELSNSKITDIFDWYELFVVSSDNKKIELLNEMSFDLLVENISERYNVCVRKLSQLTNSTICIDMTKLSPKEVFSPIVLEEYKIFVSSVAEAFDALLEIRDIFRVSRLIIEIVSKSTRKDELESEIKDLEKRIQKAVKNIEPMYKDVNLCIESIGGFYSSLTAYLNSKEDIGEYMRQTASKNGPYQWYFLYLRNFIRSVSGETLI